MLRRLQPGQQRRRVVRAFILVRLAMPHQQVIPDLGGDQQRGDTGMAAQPRVQTKNYGDEIPGEARAVRHPSRNPETGGWVDHQGSVANQNGAGTHCRVDELAVGVPVGGVPPGVEPTVRRVGIRSGETKTGTEVPVVGKRGVDAGRGLLGKC